MKKSWFSRLFSRKIKSIRGCCLSSKDYIVMKYDPKSLVKDLSTPMYQISPLKDGSSFVIRDLFEEIGRIQVFRLKGTKFKVLRIDCKDAEMENLLDQRVSDWSTLHS